MGTVPFGCEKEIKLREELVCIIYFELKCKEVSKPGRLFSAAPVPGFWIYARFTLIEIVVLGVLVSFPIRNI